MRDKECIFCKIANGEIPAATIYEDEKFRVILDLSPATKGHALVLPKDHAENLFEMPDQLLGEAVVVAKKVASKMMDVLPCDGYNIVQNNGACAGQTVMHFHIHLIPRYEGEEDVIGWKPGSLTDEVRDEIVKKMQM